MKETIDSSEYSVSEVNEKLKAIKGLFLQGAWELKQFIMRGHRSLVLHFSTQGLFGLNKQGFSCERRGTFKVI